MWITEPITITASDETTWRNYKYFVPEKKNIKMLTMGNDLLLVGLESAWMVAFLLLYHYMSALLEASSRMTGRVTLTGKRMVLLLGGKSLNQ